MENYGIICSCFNQKLCSPLAGWSYKNFSSTVLHRYFIVYSFGFPSVHNIWQARLLMQWTLLVHCPSSSCWELVMLKNLPFQPEEALALEERKQVHILHFTFFVFIFLSFLLRTKFYELPVTSFHSWISHKLKNKNLSDQCAKVWH